MNIEQLIVNGNFMEALKALDKSADKYQKEEVILLMSRVKKLVSGNILGINSRGDSQLETNRLRVAILGLAKEIDKASFIELPQITNPVDTSLRAQVQDIYQKHRRRNPVLAKQALSIIGSYNDYDRNKLANVSYDPSNRRLKGIDASARDLIRNLKEKEDDNLEAIVERVNKLIEPIEPSWDDIAEAYKLLVGRGFTDDYIKANIELRLDDDEPKFKCCDNIEEYLSSL